MERTLSDYEKIKKAEEIYNRRKMQEIGGVRVTRPIIEKSQKKELSNIKKMVLQICICIVIYFIVYLVQNSNYIFSEQFMAKTRELLTYDINFHESYTQIVNTFKDNIKFFEIKSNEDNEKKIEQDDHKIDDESKNIENAEIKEESLGIVNETEIQNSADEIIAVGGGEPENIISELAQEEQPISTEETTKSQMELDADTIKANYDLCIPIKGEITSPYGERTVAPKFHVGVDIGAYTGDTIISAMDGVVTQVSTEGDYGKHIRITSGDLVTLYAHCSKLDVTEGQEIKKGEKIAEVGETGNATGPHLHFEVILHGRYVNPEMILEW